MHVSMYHCVCVSSCAHTWRNTPRTGTTTGEQQQRRNDDHRRRGGGRAVLRVCAGGAREKVEGRTAGVLFMIDPRAPFWAHSRACGRSRAFGGRPTAHKHGSLTAWPS